MMFVSVLGCVFFFFKQRTAYEMRISDWSSDVCSSDLRAATHPQPLPSREGGQMCPSFGQPSPRFGAFAFFGAPAAQAGVEIGIGAAKPAFAVHHGDLGGGAGETEIGGGDEHMAEARRLRGRGHCAAVPGDR